MANPWDSLSSAMQQLLMCCTLVLVLAARPARTAPASPGVMAPSPPSQTAPAATTTAPPLAPAAPQPPEHVWDVEYILWAPDCKQRGMIGINGRFPGPNITAKAGDWVKVVVNNKLHTEGVVIHWHGIRQVGTPWADGTASISQCPINPGDSFTYEFKVDKPGTFFYHGHFGMQRAAGLYGSRGAAAGPTRRPVRRRAQHAAQRLAYHEAVYAQAAGLERKDDHFQWVGEPQTLLINGRGQFGCTLGAVDDAATCDALAGKKVEAACAKDCGPDDAAACALEKEESCATIRRSECGPFCNVVNETQCAPVVFDVEPDKTYRLRIASTTSLSALNVQHKLTVVEADGNAVERFERDDIDIYSGESYSVLLKTDQKASSYWISVGVRGREPKTLPALAILNYTTNTNSGMPKGTPPKTPDWKSVERSKDFTYSIKANTTEPTKYKKPPAPTATGVPPIVMLNTQEMTAGGQIKWAINRVSLALPATPYLGAYYAGLESEVFDNATEAPSGFESGYEIGKRPDAQAPELRRPVAVSNRVYRLKDGDVVDVVLQNANMRRQGVSEAHPWHLHGHDFWVLGYGDGAYVHGEAKLNTDNPPLRNTVVLFPFGWTAIRFRADNPGVWAFHCHIEPHLHLGMGVIFAEGMKKVWELNVPKEAMMCGAVSKRATIALAPPPPMAARPPPAPATSP